MSATCGNGESMACWYWAVTACPAGLSESWSRAPEQSGRASLEVMLQAKWTRHLPGSARIAGPRSDHLGGRHW